MNHGEYLHLLGEKTALERMIAETPEEDVLDHASLVLLITSTALGSFGFELEEHRTGQLSLGEPSAVAQALDRTQRLLHGTLGTDDELAESAAEANRRALDKVRGFLQMLMDNEAVCTVQLGDSFVAFRDVGQVRTSLERLSQENLREELEEFRGELQGVLPKCWSNRLNPL